MHEVFQASAGQLQALSELYINLGAALLGTELDINTRRSLTVLGRHIRAFGKLFRRLQQLSIVKFVNLPGCSELVLYYWSKVVQATESPPGYIAGMIPRMHVQCLSC